MSTSRYMQILANSPGIFGNSLKLHYTKISTFFRKAMVFSLNVWIGHHRYSVNCREIPRWISENLWKSPENVLVEFFREIFKLSSGYLPLLFFVNKFRWFNSWFNSFLVFTKRIQKTYNQFSFIPQNLLKKLKTAQKQKDISINSWAWDHKLCIFSYFDQLSYNFINFSGCPSHIFFFHDFLVYYRPCIK